MSVHEEVEEYEFKKGQYDELAIKFNVLQMRFNETSLIVGAYEDFINNKELMDEFYEFYKNY